MKKAKPQDIVYQYVKNQIIGKSMFPGNRIIEDSEGNRTTVRRDVLGNTVVSDDRGNKTSCRVDLLGKARCK